jgi:hypothetical protein
VAKINYQQLRRQKEAARKSRQQEKLDKRVQKPATNLPSPDVDCAAVDATSLPVNRAGK